MNVPQESSITHDVYSSELFVIAIFFEQPTFTLSNMSNMSPVDPYIQALILACGQGPTPYDDDVENKLDMASSHMTDVGWSGLCPSVV